MARGVVIYDYVYISGLGTFLGALTLMCFGRSSFETNLEVRPFYGTYAYTILFYMKGLLVGIGTAFLQFVTSFFIIGWFWSIMYKAYWKTNICLNA